jgi:hypothetical protein
MYFIPNQGMPKLFGKGHEVLPKFFSILGTRIILFSTMTFEKIRLHAFPAISR